MQSLQSTVTLNNGVTMPIFGLGVYNSKEETTFAVSTAIKHGYRLIDTRPGTQAPGGDLRLRRAGGL